MASRGLPAANENAPPRRNAVRGKAQPQQQQQQQPAAGRTQVDKRESVFRGDWAPTLERPAIAAQGRFEPVARAMEPLGKLASDDGAEDAPAIAAAPSARASGPPPGVTTKYVVWDRNREYRSCVTDDGRVYNAHHALIGYVAGCDAGSVSEQYLGRVHRPQFGNEYQVWAAAALESGEELIAYIDMGAHSVRLPSGGTAFDFEADGRVMHGNGTFLGRFEGARGFHDAEPMALYLLLIDPTFTAADEQHELFVAEPGVAAREADAPRPEEVRRERAKGPPADLDARFVVWDRDSEYRGCVAKDGRVLNAYNDLAGFVSGPEAGSASEEYLGRVLAPTYGNQLQVWKAKPGNDEDLLAFVDMGTHSVKWATGGTAFDLEADGRVKAANGTVLGRFQGMRSFHDAETVVLYLLLIDPEFTRDDAAPWP